MVDCSFVRLFEVSSTFLQVLSVDTICALGEACKFFDQLHCLPFEALRGGTLARA